MLGYDFPLLHKLATEYCSWIISCQFSSKMIEEIYSLSGTKLTGRGQIITDSSTCFMLHNIQVGGGKVLSDAKFLYVFKSSDFLFV